MLMPASSEFITLCQTQVSLLVQNFGASLSAIYLTENSEIPGETSLVPLVQFPEPSQWSKQIRFPPAVLNPARPDNLAKVLRPAPTSPPASANTPNPGHSVEQLANQLAPTQATPESTRMVLPLMHDEVMWGLMVVAREGRSWQQREQSQLEKIANTLAIACLLDQRSQWLAHHQEQRRVLQAHQQTNLSTLLHQFRNPLTTLRTLGKLLLKRLEPNDDSRPLLESMVSESDHLEHLLRQFDEAIDLGEAQLESELTVEIPPQQSLLPSATWLVPGDLQYHPCWIADILQPLLQAIAGRIDEKQLQLHVTIPEQLPPITADATALREVLGNLIDNAIKYTPAQGKIWLDIERQPTDNRQVVTLTDTGPGIPPQDLERIFERRYRGVQADTAIPGTGLGLAIARDLITQMRGTLRAISPALHAGRQPSHPNPGSTFIMTLPEHSASNSAGSHP